MPRERQPVVAFDRMVLHKKRRTHCNVCYMFAHHYSEVGLWGDKVVEEIARSSSPGVRGSSAK